MPATEKTWRDQAKMHVIFGISALVMLVGTIWMLAKDHNREWRKWQLDDRAREALDDSRPIGAGRGRFDGGTGPVAEGFGCFAQHEDRSGASRRVQGKVQREDESSQKAKAEVAVRFHRTGQSASPNCKRRRTAAPRQRSARQDVLDEMDEFVREAKRREDALLTTKKFERPIKRPRSVPRHPGRRRQADRRRSNEKIEAPAG